MICYKVTNGEQRSVIETEYPVQYRTNVITISHPTARNFHYYLFAFDSLIAAKKFSFFGSQIWQAEGKGPFTHLPWLPEGFSWPEGTIMFRSIQLLNKAS